MSGLKKGGLTVLAGTGVASLLILLIGNSATGKSAQETETSKQGNEVSLSSAKKASNTKNEKSKLVKNLANLNQPSINVEDLIKSNQLTKKESITILPPPGPFIEATPNKLPLNIKSRIGNAPVSPKAPVISVQSISLEKQTVLKVQKPLQNSVIPNKPQNGIAPTLKSPKVSKPSAIAQPKFNQGFTHSLIAPKQHVRIAPPPQGIVKSQMSPQTPIWMQNIPPNKPSMRKQPSRPIKQSRGYINNIQNYNMPQRYLVVPAPMYNPSFLYNYPQLPVQSNGYYFAPNLPQNMIAPIPSGMNNVMPITKEIDK